MKGYQLLKLFPFTIFLLFVGCGGGLNCPIDPPSCCYNQLFGCGTFDLPLGCECEDYGLAFARIGFRASPAKQLSSTPSGRMSGIWSGMLEQTSSSCLGAPAEIGGVIKVRERGDKVTVSVPRYGKLRGTKRGRRALKVSKSIKDPLAICSAQVSATLKGSKPGVAAARANVEYGCISGISCTIDYSGTVEKQ